MGYEIIQEEVPFFLKRDGDCVIQGSNNSALSLGADRAGDIDSGTGKGSGSALLVVGRKSKNPSFDSDSAYLYISMKTDGDKNLNTKMEGDSGSGPYGILKSDSVRIIGRKDIKFSVGEKSYHVFKNDKQVFNVGGTTITIEGKKVTIDSKKIELGPNANLGAVLVDKLTDVLNKLLLRLESHAHGPPGSTPVPASPVIIPDLASKRTFVDAG